MVRRLSEKRGWAVLFAVSVIKPVLALTTRHEWTGGTAIPPGGGCVVVFNHVSYVDPFMTAHFVHDHGRIPRYLAKAALFRNPFLRAVLTNAGQIPVERLTSRAAGAFDAAVEAVRAGNCVVVYPEGTLTRDPDGWPMAGRSGAARIALETGAPVIPVGHWGAADVLAPYGRRPHLFPRRTVRFLTGPPVDLADLRDPAGGAPDHEVTALATDRIMDALTDLVAQLRGIPAPAERFDPRRAGVSEIGNPNRTAGPDDRHTDDRTERSTHPTTDNSDETRDES